MINKKDTKYIKNFTIDMALYNKIKSSASKEGFGASEVLHYLRILLKRGLNNKTK